MKLGGIRRAGGRTRWSVSLAGLGFALLLACGGEVGGQETSACDQLQSCSLLGGTLSSCTDALDQARSKGTADACEDCIARYDCRDVSDGVCQNPCRGVVSGAGGPLERDGSSSGGPVDTRPPPDPGPEVPEEIRAFCDLAEQCQVRVTTRGSCTSVLLFGLSSNNVSLFEIQRCGDCLGAYSCDTQSCQGVCSNVLLP